MATALIWKTNFNLAYYRKRQLIAAPVDKIARGEKREGWARKGSIREVWVNYKEGEGKCVEGGKTVQERK